MTADRVKPSSNYLKFNELQLDLEDTRGTDFDNDGVRWERAQLISWRLEAPIRSDRDTESEQETDKLAAGEAARQAGAAARAGAAPEPDPKGPYVVRS